MMMLSYQIAGRNQIVDRTPNFSLRHKLSLTDYEEILEAKMKSVDL